MPKGSPNTQTKATDRYQKKAGYMVKGFKLKKDLVDEFMAACERAGETQASVISDFMIQYIKKNSPVIDEKNDT